MDARGASGGRSMLVRTRDRCESARRRTGYDRDRVDARSRWAEVILRTALWMREAPPEADLCWCELAIVAKALADGRDMTEIGLMRDLDLLRSFYARLYGCARRLRRPIYAGANSRSLRKRSPTDGI